MPVEPEMLFMDQDSRDLDVLKTIVLTGGMILNSHRGKVQNQPKASDLPPDQVRESSTAHTVVDDLVQEVCLEILHLSFPEVSVNAEENTPRVRLFSDEKDALCFHLDPLDGTLAYTRDRDDFAIGAAFSSERRFISSAVYFPALDRLYSAKRGHGVSVEDGLGNPLVLPQNAGPHFVQKRAEPLLPVVERMGLEPLDIMSAHHSMIAVAEGRARVLLYKMASPHDFGIPQVILEERGGVCSTITGAEVEFDRGFPRVPWFLAFSDPGTKEEFFGTLEKTGIDTSEI